MRRLLPLLAVLSLAFAPVPPYRPKPGELDMRMLQGEWTPEDWSMHMPESTRSRRGRLVPGGEIHLQSGSWDGTAVEINSRHAIFRLGGAIKSKWRLIPKPYKPDSLYGTMDITDLTTDQTKLGVYRLEGDTLTICYRDSGRGRPAGFTDEGQWKLVLKRKKP